MISQYSSLIAKLYDVVTNPEGWEDFLSELTKMFESDGAHVLSADLEEQKLSSSIYYGKREINLDKYLGYAFDEHDDESLRFALSHPGKPYHNGMLPDQARHRNSRVYREFLEPNGTHNFLMAVMPSEDSRRTTGIAVWREHKGGPFNDRDCDRLSELIPQLLRVVDLRSKFITAPLIDHPVVDVMQALPIGVILVDSWSHVQFANIAAQEINRRHNGLLVRHGALWGDKPDATRQLREHIRCAADTSNAPSPPLAMRIASPAGASPLLVVVSSTATQVAIFPEKEFRRGTAVVYVSDPDVRQETPESLLQRLFALTIAEARLLKALAAGNSVQEAALLNGISESTARSYLKQVFVKTSTHRQTELVHLVANSPAWLKHSSSNAPGQKCPAQDHTLAARRDYPQMGVSRRDFS